MAFAMQSQPMYLAHFGLSRHPFQLTPQPDFFYEGSDRGHLLQAVVYALMNTDGIITVTGEVGTGKTMLSRMVIEQAPRGLQLVYLANPSVDRNEILWVIAEELGIKGRKDRSTQLLRQIQTKLLSIHAKGRRVVVLVDEAHAMPRETLEEIRLLSNLETNSRKLLQILLFGQDELNETLAEPDMRPIRERITQRFEVPRLGAGDIGNYLAYRLDRAGGEREAFEPKAAAIIARASRGLIRRVNILADKSLVAAYADGVASVSPIHARQAVRDAAFGSVRGTARSQARHHWRTAVAAAAAGAIVGGAAISWPLLRYLGS